jgi:hypothetical protein
MARLCCAPEYGLKLDHLRAVFHALRIRSMLSHSV